MKENRMKMNVSRKVWPFWVVLFCTSVVLAQSPDKRSWKQRLAKQKQESEVVVCVAEQLYAEVGLKLQHDQLICTSSNQPLSLSHVNERFAHRTAQLITSSVATTSLELKKEQLTYVARLNQLVRSVTYPTPFTVTTSKLLALTAAKEQLRVIDAWCAGHEAVSEDEKLHIQLLQGVATSF